MFVLVFFGLGCNVRKWFCIFSCVELTPLFVRIDHCAYIVKAAMYKWLSVTYPLGSIHSSID